MVNNKNHTVKNQVYVIAGPTAAGKSAVAQSLAKKINGEIVNCDSVQLYKYMDIGSAKPSKKDMEEVPHHLYGIVDPRKPLTVAQYQKLALAVIDNILRRGKTPILVGGTGLYMNSVLYEMSFAAKPIDKARRFELEELAKKSGAEYMFEYLSAIDPDTAARIHPHNTRKVIRAIESWEMGTSVKPMDKLKLNSKYDFAFFALTMDRDWLYERINRRVVSIIKNGLVEEVVKLLSLGVDSKSPAMQGIGYKEIIALLNKECSTKEAINNIMKNTRHYAKRQITWLKRYDNIIWIEIKKGTTTTAVVNELLYNAPLK